ncbi:hypothetical protein LCGC14_0735270 [marine sediment metagenome]|uniref:Calcineurin-like phosphoesterase domain-containing protein n=1 Tax=marine sediment metagenome TaxID=412755 RepID=A0A0F9QTA5_9ZZZZ
MDDYAQTMLGKLEQIGRLCEKYKVKSIIGLGDIFHLKQPNRVSHALTQALIVAFNNFPTTPLIVPGNHDLGPDGLDSLPRQPLGTLVRASAVKLLLSIKDSRTGVWLIPRPYNAAAEGVHDDQADPSYYSLTEEEEALIAKNPVPLIGLAHGSIVGPGDSRPYPYVNVDKIPGIDQYDAFIAGHLHECLGVTEVGKTIFANPGSIGRTRRDMASYARTVEVLIVTVDSDGLKVEEVPLPGVAPALEVFGAREVEEGPELQDDEISKFVEMLGEGLPAEKMSLAELMAQDEFKDIEAPVKAKVQELLGGAES